MTGPSDDSSVLPGGDGPPRVSRNQDPRSFSLRKQLSSLHSLLVLSMLMFSRDDDAAIVELAISSVPSLSTCRVEAGYVTHGTDLVAVPAGSDTGVAVAEVQALAGGDGAVTIMRRWGWAYPFRSLDGNHGYLVVSASNEPTPDGRFLLRALAQQTGAALAGAQLRRRDRHHADELEALNNELATVNERLHATVSDLERQTSTHEALTRVAAQSEGMQSIAQELHELTNLPVVVEDRFGNLRVWAGPAQPEPYPKPDMLRRDNVLQRIQRAGHPLRDRGLLMALAQQHDTILGVIALVDPHDSAGRHEIFALEHGALVLATELAHVRNLAEMELRLRRDLVDDLLAGVDDESAFARGEALGHDFHLPHRAVVIEPFNGSADAGLRAVGRAAAEFELGGLLGRGSRRIVLFAQQAPWWSLHDRWGDFHSTIAQLLQTAAAIGVGGRADLPSQLVRSHREALTALSIRRGSHSANGVTRYDDLGMYRLIAPGADQREVEHFIDEWLGRLLDYDAEHDSQLCETLSEYLECGGNYDQTAKALVVHRSTVRYRLRRIREITGRDLSEADDKFNLQVAMRAWKVLGSTLADS
jgi:DNA-binding PucR family transcriptional regulator